MKQIPFWVDDSPRPVGLTSDLPSETDYLIVGSGLTGLSAALRLSEAGNSVTIIDAGEIGGGASSMNGGMVSSDVKAGVDTVHATLGPKIAAEMWKSTVNSVDSVRKLNERPGIDAITHDAGIVALGRGGKDLKAFDRSVAWYDERFPADRRVVDDRHGEGPLVARGDGQRPDVLLEPGLVESEHDLLVGDGDIEGGRHDW